MVFRGGDVMQDVARLGEFHGQQHGAALQQRHHLLAHLLQQHAVVALGGHGGMGKPDSLAQAVAGEVALSAAALAADGGDLLVVPGGEGLDDGAQDGQHLRVARLPDGDIRKRVFHRVEGKRQRVRARHKRQQRAQLQLVVHDGRVAGALGANTQARGGVAHRHRQRQFGHAERHGRDTNAAAQQLVCNSQEPTPLALNLAGKPPSVVHVGAAVEQGALGDAHMVEPELAIIYAVAAQLVAHVLDAHAPADGHVFVADADKEGVHALADAACRHPQLRKHDAPLGVHRRVGDPILLCQAARGVHHKLPRCRVVHGIRLHLHRVVAIAKFRQPKAANRL
mmetsp:Transcript_36503/g.91503  ORF Transcript_36503/g.91503 Transcript_36503/m.91503 type:complete len:338 (+) Transcript_36503:596-1609(+)